MAQPMHTVFDRYMLVLQDISRLQVDISGKKEMLHELETVELMALLKKLPSERVDLVFTEDQQRLYGARSCVIRINHETRKGYLSARVLEKGIQEHLASLPLTAMAGDINIPDMVTSIWDARGTSVSKQITAKRTI
jgi:hypothetical protein